MPRRAEKPKRVRSIRERRFGRRKTQPSFPWWIIAVAAAVLVVTIIVTLLLINRNRGATIEPTITLPAPAEEPASTTVGGTPTGTLPAELPPPTLTPQPTATQTPQPQLCRATQTTWVRAGTSDSATGFTQLAPGDEIGVIGVVQDGSGASWYLVAGYASPAYVRAETVTCGGQ